MARFYLNIFCALLLTSTYLAVLISIRAHEHQVAGAYLLGLEISTLYCVQGSQCIFYVLTLQVLIRNKLCISVLSKSSKFFNPQTLCWWVIFKHFLPEWTQERRCSNHADDSNDITGTMNVDRLDCDFVDVEEQQLAQHFVLDNNQIRKFEVCRSAKNSVESLTKWTQTPRDEWSIDGLTRWVLTHLADLAWIKPHLWRLWACLVCFTQYQMLRWP